MKDCGAGSPVEGRAKEALVAFLAETFRLPKKSVELVNGELSRSKVFLLRGLRQDDVRKFLDLHTSSAQ